MYNTILYNTIQYNTTQCISFSFKTTSPKVLNREQLLESSEECSPDAREEESLTSGNDLQ